MVDNYELWLEHERQQQQWLLRRPKCCSCQEHIQDDYFYEIDGENYCQNCLDANFRMTVEDDY